MTTCQAPHRYDTMFTAIPEDQSYPFRHKCAGCAYELGFQAGYTNQEPSATTALNSILKKSSG